MSTLPIVPTGSVARRAAIVLLATLLAHAWLLQHVDRILAGAEHPAQDEPVAVIARLLPPPEVRPAAPSPPAPRPRPASVPRKPPAAVAPVISPPTADAPAAVDVGADAFGVEAATAEVPAVADAAAAAETPPVVEQATEEEPFEASGATLLAALANVPDPGAVLPSAARYVFRTTNSEIRLASGTSTVDWSLSADGRYRLSLTTTAIGVTVLELESQGWLRAFGLAPERYTETRIRRGAVATNFDWEGRRVTFSSRPHERPLADGVQDRISFQFQLMLLGRVRPESFREGRQIVLRMAGRDDVSIYRFRATGRAATVTGVGELSTIRVERVAAGDSDARIEVWLAPSLGWLPARLRFTDRYGRVTESVLESMPTS